MSSRLRAGHWSSVLQLGSSLFPSTLTGELGIGELSLLVKSCQTWQKGGGTDDGPSQVKRPKFWDLLASWKFCMITLRVYKEFG